MLAPEFTHSVPVDDILHYQTSLIKSVLRACQERIECVVSAASMSSALRACQLAPRNERIECVVRATNMSHANQVSCVAIQRHLTQISPSCAAPAKP